MKYLTGIVLYITAAICLYQGFNIYTAATTIMAQNLGINYSTLGMVCFVGGIVCFKSTGKE